MHRALRVLHSWWPVLIFNGSFGMFAHVCITSPRLTLSLRKKEMFTKRHIKQVDSQLGTLAEKLLTKNYAPNGRWVILKLLVPKLKVLLQNHLEKLSNFCFISCGIPSVSHLSVQISCFHWHAFRWTSLPQGCKILTLKWLRPFHSLVFPHCYSFALRFATSFCAQLWLSLVNHVGQHQRLLRYRYRFNQELLKTRKQWIILCQVL